MEVRRSPRLVNSKKEPISYTKLNGNVVRKAAKASSSIVVKESSKSDAIHPGSERYQIKLTNTSSSSSGSTVKMTRSSVVIEGDDLSISELNSMISDDESENSWIPFDWRAFLSEESVPLSRLPSCGSSFSPSVSRTISGSSNTTIQTNGLSSDAVSIIWKHFGKNNSS